MSHNNNYQESDDWESSGQKRWQRTTASGKSVLHIHVVYV